MILPGSEHLQRYPHHSELSVDRGIKVFGTVKGLSGQKIYKVPLWDEDRAVRLGFQLVLRGNHYCYVQKG